MLVITGTTNQPCRSPFSNHQLSIPQILFKISHFLFLQISVSIFFLDGAYRSKQPPCMLSGYNQNLTHVNVVSSNPHAHPPTQPMHDPGIHFTTDVAPHTHLTSPSCLPSIPSPSPSPSQLLPRYQPAMLFQTH